MISKKNLLLVIIGIFFFSFLRSQGNVSNDSALQEEYEHVVQALFACGVSEKDLSEIFSTVNSQQQRIALNEQWIDFFLGLWGPCLCLGFLTYLTDTSHYTYEQYLRDEDSNS